MARQKTGRTRARPLYTAKLTRVPTLELGKADIEFTVKRRGRQYGVLAISRGALVWRPSRYDYEYRVRWPSLDVFAVDNGEELRRPRHGNRRKT